jgi:hypothetical protein
MTQIEAYTAPSAAIGSRLARLPLVLLLMSGLLLSLIHCAGCELNFSSRDALAVTMSHDQGSAPDTPEHMLPCHSGHCLSHVAAQQASAVALPGDLHPRALIVRQERFPLALAGLPLFKPPRA